jgi:hypothetical protein
MRQLVYLFLALELGLPLAGQEVPGTPPDPTQPQQYILRRVSSWDRTGANDDSRPLAVGKTLTLLEEEGPGVISHIWITIGSDELFYLKKLVLRMYWDNEPSPSVEAPLGDFFGLGLGEYFVYQSAYLAVAPTRGMNCFFAMPFQKKALITLTNEGQQLVREVYFNIDYRAYPKPLPAETLYFHAQYRQATPAVGWTTNWQTGGEPWIDKKPNLDGEGNYTWMEATGHGNFMGVTMSVLQNQDSWLGEGDDMFFIDGAKLPSITGTGTEDYFLGAYCWGGEAFFFDTFGTPVTGLQRAGSRWSMYRFHRDAPITFTKSLRATVEHGHANHRSDNYFSVAFWYQNEPHAAFPPLPAVDQRLPRLYAVGGPGAAQPR